MQPNSDLQALLVFDHQQQIRADAANMRNTHSIGFARRLTGNAVISIGERIAGSSRRDLRPTFPPFEDVVNSALHPAK